MYLLLSTKIRVKYGKRQLNDRKQFLLNFDDFVTEAATDGQENVVDRQKPLYDNIFF